MYKRKKKGKEKKEKKVVIKIGGGIRIGRLIKTVLILLIVIFLFSTCASISSCGAVDCTFGCDSKSDRPATGGNGLFKVPGWFADLLPARPDWWPDFLPSLFEAETTNPGDDSGYDGDSGDDSGYDGDSGDDGGNTGDGSGTGSDGSETGSNGDDTDGGNEDGGNENGEGDDNSETDLYIIRFIDEHSNFDVSYNTDLDGKLSSFPTPSERDGYTFRGWYDELNWISFSEDNPYYRPYNSLYCNTEWIFSSNTTLRAYWRKNEYVTVHFYVNIEDDAPYASLVTNKYGSLESYPYNPEKEGYYFQYWVLEDTNYPLTTDSIHDFECSYYAKFGEEPFDGNNGNIVNNPKDPNEDEPTDDGNDDTTGGGSSDSGEDDGGKTEFDDISFEPMGGSNTTSGEKVGDYTMYSPDGETSTEYDDFNSAENDRDVRYVYVKFFYEYEHKYTNDNNEEVTEYYTIYFGMNENYEFLIDTTLIPDGVELIYSSICITDLINSFGSDIVYVSELYTGSLMWAFVYNDDGFLCVQIDDEYAFIVGGRDSEGVWHPLPADGSLYNGHVYELIPYEVLYPN